MDTSYQDTGLDWSTDSFTPGEYESLTNWYVNQHGLGNLDLVGFVPFMHDLRPDALKRYRQWVEAVTAGKNLRNPIGSGTVLIWLHYYCVNSFAQGFMYEVLCARERGATKAEVAQAVAIAWLHGGPFGINSAAGAAMAYMKAWSSDESRGLTWPNGWGTDPDAFHSGIALAPSNSMSDEERAQLADWHVRVQGEIPSYVTFLSKHNPAALRSWRARYESAMRGPLPKQIIALFQVHTAMMLRQPESLRRAVHMARSFGVAKDQVVQVLAGTQVYLGDLGMEAIGAVAEVMDNWDEALAD